MNNTKSNVPLQFGFSIKNATLTAKNIALFAGTIPSIGLAADGDGKVLLTKGDPTQLNKAGIGTFDAVLSDGILPLEGVIDKTEANISVEPLDPRFTVEHMVNYLRSNSLIVKRMIIKATSQDQFDNQLSFAVTTPFKSLGISAIAPTNYSLPTNFQNNKIIIDDVPFRLQDDTFVGWKINAGETVNITFELED